MPYFRVLVSENSSKKLAFLNTATFSKITRIRNIILSSKIKKLNLIKILFSIKTIL